MSHTDQPPSSSPAESSAPTTGTTSTRPTLPTHSRTAKDVLATVMQLGKKKPVEGASLSVGGSTTNSKGYTKVEVSKKTRIVARKTDTIPSNRVLIKIKK